jgi:serine/threonine protein kinase HipA of HipAB toxin-antitoxin module
MIHSGEIWILAPVYDLLNLAKVKPDDTEELALTLEEKKKMGTFRKIGCKPRSKPKTN